MIKKHFETILYYTMENSYKVVYYDNNKQFHVEITNDLDKYKQFHTRVYPKDYEPINNEGYGIKELIDSW